MTEAGLGRTLELLRIAYEHRALSAVGIGTTSGAEGFVVGYGPAWTLVAVLDAAHYDGWFALPTPEVTRVEVHLREPVRVRALRERGEWPPPVPAPLSVASTREVLAMASDCAPVVRLEMEYSDVLHIGRVVRLTDAEVELLEIDAEAEWDDEATTYALADVDRIGFGGEYDAALYAVGGEPPQPDKTG